MKAILKIIIIGGFFFFIIGSNQAQSVTVFMQQVSEIDGRIEGYQDDIRVRLNNTTGTALSVNLLLELNGLGGELEVSSFSIYQDYPVVLNPGLNEFSIRQIINIYEGVDLESLIEESMMPVYINNHLLDERRLPPGDYETCLSVYNADDFSFISSDCLDIGVPLRDAPVIQYPADQSNGSWIPESDVINFSWYHIGASPSQEYTLEVKSFANRDQATDFNDQGRPDDYFYGLEDAIVPQEDIVGFNFPFYTYDQVHDFFVGGYYAVRVTAESEVDGFDNYGRSNIVIFAFGVEEDRICENPGYDISLQWPSTGDTLPFRNFAYLFDISPVCNSTKSIRHIFEISSPEGTIDRLDITNDYRPYAGRRGYWENFAEENGLLEDWFLADDDLLSYYQVDFGTRNHTLVPNISGYRLGANFVIESQNQRLGEDTEQMNRIVDMHGQSFYTGMPTPRLIKPINKSSINQGLIEFSFSTGVTPGNLLPAVQFIQSESGSLTNPFLDVKEKAVIQISKTEEFNTADLVDSRLIKLEVSSAHPENGDIWNPFFSESSERPIQELPDRSYSDTEFRNAVYRTINYETTIDEPGKYYWRVVWLQNPAEISVTDPAREGIDINMEDIYRTSATYTFKIEDGCSDPEYAIDAVYPAVGDTLPFAFIPCMVQFNPFCRNYSRFEFEFNLENENTSYIRSDRNIWPDGPRDYLIETLGMTEEIATEERATLGYFNIRQEQERSMGMLEKGMTYSWSATTSMYLSDEEEPYTDNIETQSFIHGMTQPQAEYPQNRQTISPGQIDFVWNSNAPSRLFPQVMDLLIADGREVMDHQKIGNITEKALIQISRTNSFGEDDILHGWHEEVEFVLTKGITEEEIIAGVYNDKTHAHEIIEEGTYYWRIAWLKQPDTGVSPLESINEDKIYHPAIYEFTIGEVPDEEPIICARMFDEETDDGPESEEAGEAECVASCRLPEITNRTTKTSFSTGDIVKVGKFDMELQEVSNSSGRLSGRGLVIVPFLNDVKMQCTFENIRINTTNEMYEGTVKAIEDENPFDFSSGHASIPSVDEDQLEMFDEWLFDNTKMISLLSGGEIGLPIGMDRDVLGKKVSLGIIKMEFHPQEAYIDAVAAVDIPEINWISSVGAADICIQPEGFTTDSVLLYQAYESEANIHNATFKLKGGRPVTTEGVNYDNCYAAFGCDGFSHFQIAMEVEFSIELLTPQNEAGLASTDPEETVKFQAAARYDVGDGLIAKMTFDKPFYLSDKKEFALNMSEAWLDLSSKLNPSSLEFPDNYDLSLIEDLGEAEGGSTPAAWTGFYLKSLNMQIPDFYSTSEDTRAEIAINDFIIDGSGITFSAGAYDLIQNGQIAEWEASLDTVELQITQSTFDYFKMNGKITPPISETSAGGGLRYNVVLDYTPESEGEDEESTESSTSFFIAVDIVDSVQFDVKVLASEMTLYRGSYIEVGYDGEVYVEANFTGNISISDEQVDAPEIPGMDLPGISFQNFLISTSEGISCEEFSFASPEKSAAGFPLSIESMSLGGSLNQPELDIAISLNFQSGENGISATGAFSILGELYKNENDNTKFRLRAPYVRFNGLLIRAEMSAMKMIGGVCWQKDEEGERFDGVLLVELPSLGVGVGLEGTFGKVYDDPSTSIEDGYRYWRVDAQVKFGEAGIPLFAGISLYAIGGGFWHHMELDVASLPSSKAIFASGGNSIEVDTSSTADPCAFISAVSSSGARYIPNKDKMLGFRIAAMIGSQGSSSLVNCEVQFIAEINNNGGLDMLRIDGGVYVMQEMGTGGESSSIELRGNMSIIYTDTPESGKQVDGNFSVYMNVFDVLKGAADESRPNLLVEASFHADAESWWFHMGKIENREVTGGAKLKLTIPIGDEGVDLAECTTYLMVGHGIPAHLPNPPDWISNILGRSSQTSSKGSIEGESANVKNTIDPDILEQINNGIGMAFGLQTNFSIGFDAFIYFQLRLGLGFDLMIRKAPYDCANANGDQAGINGWRASGQAYLGLEGELGIKFRFFGERKIPLLYLGVAILLQAQAPNPSYFKGEAGVRFEVLGGVISGQKTVVFEAGERCQIMLGDPLANIKFIEDLHPQGTGVDVGQGAEALFAFPIGELLELPKTMDEETMEITSYYKFIPEVTDFNIRPKNTNNNIELQNLRWDNSNQHLKVLPANWMDGDSDYEVFCEVKVKDHSIYTQKERDKYSISYPRGSYYRNPETPHTHWVEDSTMYFSTGAYPDTIPLSNVKFTYPIEKQRYYLQEESLNTGMLKLKVGMQSGSQTLFYREKDGEEYEYVARFVPLNDIENPIGSPIAYNGGTNLYIDIPRLDNNTTYSLHLVRKPLPKAQVFLDAQVASDNDDSSPGQSSILTSNLSGLINTSRVDPNVLDRITIHSSFARKALIEGYYLQRERRLNPSNFVSSLETNLFQIYFKTSEYDNLRDKLSNAEIDARTPSASANFRADYSADIEISGLEEDFDEFDLFGYRDARGYKQLPALLKIRDTYNHDYWKETYASQVFRDIQAVKNHRSVVLEGTGIVNLLGIRQYRLDNKIVNGFYDFRHPEGIPAVRPSVPSYSFNRETYHDNALTQDEMQSEFSSQFVSSGNNVSGFLGATAISGLNVTGTVPSFMYSGAGIQMPYIPPTHFATRSGKLLINYNLRRNVEISRLLAQLIYNRFYYESQPWLKVSRIYNLDRSIDYDLSYPYHNKMMKVDLGKPFWQYLRDDGHRSLYFPLSKIMNYHNTTEYLTERTYKDLGEFGGKWLTNEYEIEYIYQLPNEIFRHPKYQQRSRYRRGYTRYKERYNLIKDHTRFPQTSVF